MNKEDLKSIAEKLLKAHRDLIRPELDYYISTDGVATDSSGNVDEWILEFDDKLRRVRMDVFNLFAEVDQLLKEKP